MVQLFYKLLIALSFLDDFYLFYFEVDLSNFNLKAIQRIFLEIDLIRMFSNNFNSIAFVLPLPLDAQAFTEETGQQQ